MCCAPSLHCSASFRSVLCWRETSPASMNEAIQTLSICRAPLFHGSASLIHATLKGTLSSKTWILPRRTRPVPRSTISTVHPSAHDTQHLAPWSSIALPDLLNHSSDIRERKRTVHWQDLPFHLPQKVPGLRPSRMNIVNLHALLSHCGWAHGGHVGPKDVATIYVSRTSSTCSSFEALSVESLCAW
jgi:hypothetical protein